MNEQVNFLQELLNDVKGNARLGNPRKMAGYLMSISTLAGAMSRRCWQQFELGAAEELEEDSDKGLLKVKKQLAQRELELAELETKLAKFAAAISCGAYLSKEDAATSLRKIAESIESKHSELFPKPLTEDEYKAYAESVGGIWTTAEDAKVFLDAIRGAAMEKRSKARAMARV